MKRRPTITDYFIKASYSTENYDDKNEDEEFLAPPGSKKNKDIPHISEISELDPVKGKSIAFTLLSKGLGPYQPEMDKYPKVNGRKFCTQWYKAFDLSDHAEESFTINGFNKWSKALTCLSKHERSVPHKEAMVQLAVDLTKQVKQIRNMFGVLNTLHNFIGASSKRFSIFESMRATCSDKAIKAVFENLSALFHSLHKIANDDTFAGPEASSLLKSIETFDFIFCLNLLKFVFNETNILSKYLQTQSINYLSVRLMAQQTINTFKDSRTQDKFNSLWIETQDIVEK
ncbi:hypothetical protein AGLY_017690 [Aphis glycines]|uniref:DUF4371 domain-containing protein n=1 Tax=Aphis glycines TaxID=307491 RepID=A0A6G0SU45_APHGL|nr:hypothetical protein AGLY_017690 [Aphis glycines]